jgi:hypothetical protein
MKNQDRTLKIQKIEAIPVSMEFSQTTALSDAAHVIVGECALD